ncbi:hypothetical protein KR074_003058, partial [Drosophila pseudoananassae]
KQRSGESVEDYIQMMLTLRARLETPVSDFDLIKIIKMNLRERISKVVYPIHVTNLEQLRHECHDAERMLTTRWSRQAAEGEHQRGFSYRPRVEELEDQQEDEDGWPEEGEQKLYLGVDFWRKFHITPEVVGVESLENVETEFHSKGEPVEPHTLTNEQKERLDKVKEGFLAYENQGLGLTTMEQHTIQLVEGAVPKSKFCFKYLRYLGYVLGDGALKTDPRKIAAIKEIEVPKNVRQLRSFLGTANWYRRFIKNFSEISAPLTNCLKRGKGLQWTPEAEVAFQ